MRKKYTKSNIKCEYSLEFNWRRFVVECFFLNLIYGRMQLEDVVYCRLFLTREKIHQRMKKNNTSNCSKWKKKINKSKSVFRLYFHHLKFI